MSTITIRPDSTISAAIPESGTTPTGTAAWGRSMAEAATTMAANHVSLSLPGGRSLSADTVAAIARRLERGDQAGAQRLLDEAAPGLRMQINDFSHFVDDLGPSLARAAAENPGATGLQVVLSDAAMRSLHLRAGDGAYTGASATSLDVVVIGGGTAAPDSAPSTRSGAASTVERPRDERSVSDRSTSGRAERFDRLLSGLPDDVRNSGLLRAIGDDIDDGAIEHGLYDTSFGNTLNSEAFLRDAGRMSETELREAVWDAVGRRYADASPPLSDADHHEIVESVMEEVHDGIRDAAGIRVLDAARGVVTSAAEGLEDLAGNDAELSRMVETLAAMPEGDERRHLLQGLNLEGVTISTDNLEEIAACLQERASELRAESRELFAEDDIVSSLGAFRELSPAVRSALSVGDGSVLDTELDRAFAESADEEVRNRWMMVGAAFVAGATVSAVTAGAGTGAVVAAMTSATTMSGPTLARAWAEADTARRHLSAGIGPDDAVDVADAGRRTAVAESIVSVAWAGTLASHGAHHLITHWAHVPEAGAPLVDAMLHTGGEMLTARILHPHSGGRPAAETVVALGNYRAGSEALEGRSAAERTAATEAMAEACEHAHITGAEDQAEAILGFLLAHGGEVAEMDAEEIGAALTEYLHARDAAGGHH